MQLEISRLHGVAEYNASDFNVYELFMSYQEHAFDTSVNRAFLVLLITW